TVKFVKKDAAFQFDVQVPRDAEIAKPKRPITTDSQGGTKVAGQDDGTQNPQITQSDESSASSAPAPPKLGQVRSSEGGSSAWDAPQQRGRAGGAGRGTQPSKNRSLHFEYDMATGNVDLLDDDYKAPQRPRWASPSPDGKTIVFAREHNLFMMD